MVAGTLSDTELPVGSRKTRVIAENNVPESVVMVHDATDIYLIGDSIPYMPPIGERHMIVIHEVASVIGSIHEAKSHSPCMAESHNEVPASLPGNFIDDEGIVFIKIESVETLLLPRNAQLEFIGIIEKKQCPEHCTLPGTLIANQMDVPVKAYFGIRDVRTVDKYDFIQVSHLSPPQIW